jgi:uncharacterized membrane protein
MNGTEEVAGRVVTVESAWGAAVPGGAGVALLLALAFAVLVGLDLRGLAGRVKRERVPGLAGLRVVSAVLVWLVAVQPTVRRDDVSEEEGRLAVLLDVSRSMEVRASSGRRRDELEALARGWMEGTDETPPPVFAFGATTRTSRLGDPHPGRDDDTLLGAALESAIETDPSIGAVVVASDGADRGGGAIEAATALGIRVHTVALGEGPLRDDGIAEASIDRVAFLRRPARVRAVVRRIGAPGGPIPVRLFGGAGGDVPIAERIVEVPEDGTAEVSFEVNLSELGRALFTVSIPSPAGDAVPENDRRALLTRVVRDHLRVLHVAGQPSWDQRWLRGLFERDPTMDLISFFILRSGTDMVMADASDLALIPFPTDELFSEHLGSFDVVFFQNFEYAPYAMDVHLPRIREYVERGGSFAMIGGPLSFSAAGYAETDIQQILPVEVLPRSTPPSVATTSDRFRPVVARGAERHPLVMLGADPSTSADAWAALAPLAGLNVVARSQPDALVLLTHPSDHTSSGEPSPVLAISEPGRGRSLAVMTDTTWRWGITSGGATGDASFYERFWDRALRWLARDPTLDPVRVTTDRERYGAGARVVVRGTLRDGWHAPLVLDAPARLVIVDDGEHEVGAVPVALDETGAFEAAMSAPEVAGGFRLRLLGERGGEPVRAEEPFVVETGGDELADPRARPDLLEALSRATEGTHVRGWEGAPRLGDLDATRVRTLGTELVRPLASGWAIVLVMGVLGVEWILRRRWGVR